MNIESTAGTPTSNGPQAPPSLYITAKHIQASRALLELAKANGALLDSSWHLVLTTLQVSIFKTFQLVVVQK